MLTPEKGPALQSPGVQPARRDGHRQRSRQIIHKIFSAIMNTNDDFTSAYAKSTSPVHIPTGIITITTVLSFNTNCIRVTLQYR
jgi:hypothetical protein